MEETKTLNKILSDSPNELKFDVLKIDSTIKKDKIYKDEGNIFQFCTEFDPNQVEQDIKIDIPKYMAKIKSNSFEYLGILSKNLKKENYGYNHFDNGDEYFGQWNKDKKEGYGIYFFKEEENPSTIKQIYIGEFKNNAKYGEGIYFKVDKFDIDKEKNGVPIDFTLIIGNFSEDNFIKGIIFTMEDGKRKIYKGKMSKDGKKNDENAEIYEDEDKIFYGIVKDNAMLEGRIIIMKDGKKETAYYFNRKGSTAIDSDIDFDYEKKNSEDDKYIRKLNELNNIFDYEKIQNLFISVMKIREKVNNPENFEYIKMLNYDMDVKQELKNQYGRYLYC
jgi:hypothetical protein